MGIDKKGPFGQEFELNHVPQPTTDETGISDAIAQLERREKPGGILGLLMDTSRNQAKLPILGRAMNLRGEAWTHFANLEDQSLAQVTEALRNFLHADAQNEKAAEAAAAAVVDALEADR